LVLRSETPFTGAADSSLPLAGLKSLLMVNSPFSSGAPVGASRSD
jgi:hypothetical protein